ncbi:MAG: response regulator [Pirellula sp.]
MRLLIADSDPTMTELYESYFSDKGYDVTAVGNGIQCIDAIREQMPDVLVLEHKLPWGGDDGILECLRQDYPFTSPEVVLLDSHGASGQQQRNPHSDVRAHLHKPFLMRDLHKLVQSVGQPQVAAHR